MITFYISPNLIDSCIVISLVGGYVMFRRRVGLFRHMQGQRRNTVVSINVGPMSWDGKAGKAGNQNTTEYDLVKEGLMPDKKLED